MYIFLTVINIFISGIYQSLSLQRLTGIFFVAGLNSAHLGHVSVSVHTSSIQPPAECDVRQVGRHRPHYYVITGSDGQSVARE